jgi:hypothetical protein
MSDKRHDREIFTNALNQVRLNESKIELDNSGNISYNNKQPINEILGTLIAGGLLGALAGVKIRGMRAANKREEAERAEKASKADLEKRNVESQISSRAEQIALSREAASEAKLREIANRKERRKTGKKGRRAARNLAKDRNDALLKAAAIKAAETAARAGLPPVSPPPAP